jgi:CubicO group peptidase (beta-lactamase class C family)
MSLHRYYGHTQTARLKKVVMNVFAGLCAAVSTFAFGQINGFTPEVWKPHNYTLPSNCLAGAELVEASSKMKTLMNQSGTLGAGYAISYRRDLVVGCGQGYNDGLAWKKLALSQSPVLAETTNLVAVASVSKSIADIALWQLFDQGKVNLDDNIVLASGIKSFNGLVNPAYASCSIRGAMVLTHSCRIDLRFQVPSVIERDTGWKRPITFDQQMSYEVGKPTLQTVTGDYNNVGYALITRIIERALGMSFIDYVRTQIFNPIGVSDENVDMIFGGYQMCADSKWTTTQGVQYCTNFAAVELDEKGMPLARKPGEMFRDLS